MDSSTDCSLEKSYELRTLVWFWWLYLKRYFSSRLNTKYNTFPAPSCIRYAVVVSEVPVLFCWMDLDGNPASLAGGCLDSRLLHLPRDGRWNRWRKRNWWSQGAFLNWIETWKWLFDWFRFRPVFNMSIFRFLLENVPMATRNPDRHLPTSGTSWYILFVSNTAHLTSGSFPVRDSSTSPWDDDWTPSLLWKWGSAFLHRLSAKAMEIGGNCPFVWVRVSIDS